MEPLNETYQSLKSRLDNIKIVNSYRGPQIKFSFLNLIFLLIRLIFPIIIFYFFMQLVFSLFSGGGAPTDPPQPPAQ